MLLPLPSLAPPDGEIFGPVFAANGDIAFTSRAGNLVPGDDNEAYDVFVWDSSTNAVERVSVAADGAPANDDSGAILFHKGATAALDISDDGRFVAFASMAAKLTADPGQTCQDYRGYERACINIFIHDELPVPINCGHIYLYDTETGNIALVDKTSDGRAGNGISSYPAVSADGRIILFASTADNLVPGDTNRQQDIFLYNWNTGQMERISTTN